MQTTASTDPMSRNVLGAMDVLDVLDVLGAMDVLDPLTAARDRATSAPKNTARPCVPMTTPARRRVILPGTP